MGIGGDVFDGHERQRWFVQQAAVKVKFLVDPVANQSDAERYGAQIEEELRGAIKARFPKEAIVVGFPNSRYSTGCFFATLAIIIKALPETAAVLTSIPTMRAQLASALSAIFGKCIAGVRIEVRPAEAGGNGSQPAVSPLLTESDVGIAGAAAATHHRTIAPLAGGGQILSWVIASAIAMVLIGVVGWRTLDAEEQQRQLLARLAHIEERLSEPRSTQVIVVGPTGRIRVHRFGETAAEEIE